MHIDIAIYNGSQRVAYLPTHKAFNFKLTQNKHGFGSLSFDLALSASQLADFYANRQLLSVKAWSSGKPLLDGRLEDTTINGNVLTLTALGQWSAHSDLAYTAFWSASGVKDWRVLPVTLIVNRAADKYTVSFEQQINAALIKNTAYGNTTDILTLAFYGPDQGQTNLTGISFDLEYILPLNWRVEGYTRNAALGNAGNILTSNSGGALTKFSFNISCAVPQQVITFEIYNNSGVPTNYAGETGANYVRFTNMRVVGSVANRINTTLTGAIVAGVGVTASVGSTARMYAGGQLTIDTGNFNSETITVTQVLNSTQFIATFVNNHAIGQPVNAHVIYPDEIVKNIITRVATLNPSQISTATGQIITPQFDLLNESYTDANMGDILDYLASIGNGTLAYQTDIARDKVLRFAPIGTFGRTWYIYADLNQLSLQTTVSTLFNSIYAVYKDPNGRRLASAATTDLTALLPITRQRAVAVDTTNATLATQVRDKTVADTKLAKPATSIPVLRVFNSVFASVPVTEVAPYDTVIIVNLPPSGKGTAIDRVRSFRVLETEITSSGQLIITPETPIRSVDYLLAVNAIDARDTTVKDSDPQLEAVKRSSKRQY